MNEKLNLWGTFGCVISIGSVNGIFIGVGYGQHDYILMIIGILNFIAFNLYIWLKHKYIMNMIDKIYADFRLTLEKLSEK